MRAERPNKEDVMKRTWFIVAVAVALVGALATVGFGADKLIVKDAGGTNNVFVVTDTGRVGVNVAAPLYKGDFSGNSANSSQLHFSEAGTDVGGWLSSNLDNNFFVSSGAAYIGGQWIQKSPDGKAVLAGSGGLGYRVFTTSGGTVGNPIALQVRLHVDYSGNVGINKAAVAGRAIDTSTGAYLSSGGVWTDFSSREAKQDIDTLTTTEAMDTLQGLSPVKYAYKVDSAEKHVGFIAEDVPALVATKDRKGISPMDIVAVLTKVVQEQQKTIAELNEKIQNLEGRMAQREIADAPKVTSAH